MFGISYGLGAMIPTVLLIRNAPPGQEQAPGTAGQKHAGKPDAAGAAVRTGLSFQFAMLTLAMLMNGVVGLTASQAKSMLYRTTNHEMAVVSAVISLGGGVLIVSKILFGKMADLLGPRPTMILALSILTAGFVLMTFTQDAPDSLLYVTETLYNIGAPVCTVGISILAADFSTQETFAKVLKNCQVSYTFGGLASSVMPGAVADLTGSYIPAYWLIVCCALVFLASVVFLYRGSERKKVP